MFLKYHGYAITVPDGGSLTYESHPMFSEDGLLVAYVTTVRIEGTIEISDGH